MSANWKVRVSCHPDAKAQAGSGRPPVRRWGQLYTVDVSNAVLTLGTSYAPRLFSEPVKSDGKITTSYRDPAGGILKFIGHGNGEYELIAPLTPCYYRLGQ
jgi:hypothetical protein